MTKSPPTSGLRQAEMILALSLATDLGTGRPMEWGRQEKDAGLLYGPADIVVDTDGNSTSVRHITIVFRSFS